MSDTEEDATASEGPQQPSAWRVWRRVALGIYLVTLPACTHNAGHFGPGFFPLLAALVLVPLFALVSASEAVTCWIEVARERTQKSKWAAAVLMSLMAAAYCSIVAYAILEKTGG